MLLSSLPSFSHRSHLHPSLHTFYRLHLDDCLRFHLFKLLKVSAALGVSDITARLGPPSMTIYYSEMNARLSNRFKAPSWAKRQFSIKAVRFSFAKNAQCNKVYSRFKRRRSACAYLEAVLEMMELLAGSEQWWWPHLPQYARGEPGGSERDWYR